MLSAITYLLARRSHHQGYDTAQRVLLQAVCCCLLGLVPWSLWAQDSPHLYDIEIVVFRHAGPATLQPQALTDYTAVPIPLNHPSQDPRDAQTPSPGMETVWRKLTNSGAYETLWYTRWRQATSNYNRPKRFRIHDTEQLIRPQFKEFDPFNWEQELPPGSNPDTAGTNPNSATTDSTGAAAALDAQGRLWEQTEQDLASAFKVAFPATEHDENHYRLDGWLSFSRQRFYHIGLELELRSTDPWGDSGDTLRSDDRIQQSRRIEIGRYEYFDTPGLAVLVLVQEVAHPVAAAPLP